VVELSLRKKLDADVGDQADQNGARGILRDEAGERASDSCERGDGDVDFEMGALFST
jgi:hypothetical protein